MEAYQKFKSEGNLSINLVPRAFFPGFGGGKSQVKAPWGRGCRNLLPSRLKGRHAKLLPVTTLKTVAKET